MDQDTQRRCSQAGILALVVAANLGVPGQSYAKVEQAQAQELGVSLTPYGAEKQGASVQLPDDSMLTIPEWRGGLLKKDWPENYTKAGQHHPDPYKDDQPLFTINQSNMADYDSLLTEGHKALLKTYPTFNMPVFQSRRSHSAPQWVYDNIAENALKAELTADGNGVRGAYGGVAFPILNDSPEAALQVVWNHMTRFRGVYVLRDASEVAVHQNGDYQLVSSVQDVYFNYYRQDGGLDTLNNILFYYLSTTNAPARLAGSSTLVHEPLNHVENPRQAWKYNAGQRRVRRAPSLAFDAPIAAADGLRTADDTDIYNGSPERYNWELIGLQEKIIPYNNYQLDDPSISYARLLQKGHIDPIRRGHLLP